MDTVKVSEHNREQPKELVLGFIDRHRSAAAIVVAISVLSAVVGAAWTAYLRQYDLAVYIMGAHHLFDGTLYRVRLTYQPFLPFTYPPFSALVFTPLTVLPHQAAKLVWSAVNLVSLIGLLVVSFRALMPSLDRTKRWMLVGLFLGPTFWLEPVLLNFHFGQINLVLGLIILTDLTVNLEFRGRKVPRGLLLGFAAAIKLTPLVFVAYLFVAKERRAALIAAVSFVTFELFSSLLSPSAAWSFWTHDAFDAKRVGTIAYLSNQSMRGALDRISHTEVSSVLITVLAVVVLGLGLWLARTAARESSWLLGILVTAVTGILVSPISWCHHLIWLVPIVLWCCFGSDRPRFGVWWALAASMLYWWAPVWIPSPVTSDLFREGPKQVLESTSFFVSMVMFLVGVTLMLRSRRRKDTPLNALGEFVVKEEGS